MRWFVSRRRDLRHDKARHLEPMGVLGEAVARGRRDDVYVAAAYACVAEYKLR